MVLEYRHAEEIEIQAIIKKWDFKDSKLIYIFVKVVGQGKDEFYIIRLQDLQETILKDYSKYLKKHGGRRPKNPKTMNFAVLLRHLAGYRDNWKLLQKDRKK